MDLTFTHRPSAIDGEDLAGDEFGIGREQHERGGIAVFGVADAAAVEGLLGFDEGHDVVVRRGAFRHRCLDERGSDDVHTDVLRRVVGGNGLAEADDARFRGGVGVRGSKFRRGRVTKHAGHVEDDASSA